MLIKNPTLFYLASDPGEMPYACIVKDQESNSSINTLPENSRLVLFSGKQDLVYSTSNADAAEVSQLEETNDAYLDTNTITINMPSVPEVNTLVDVSTSHVSHTMPFRLKSANSAFALAYYDLSTFSDEYDITHKCAIVSNGSITIDSNNNKLIYIVERPRPFGKPQTEPSYTTGYDTNPIQTNNVVTISTADTVYVVVVEYKTD